MHPMKSEDVVPTAQKFSQQIPPKLLEEIRNHHNLIPAPARGSALSKAFQDAATAQAEGDITTVSCETIQRIPYSRCFCAIMAALA